MQLLPSVDEVLESKKYSELSMSEWIGILLKLSRAKFLLYSSVHTFSGVLAMCAMERRNLSDVPLSSILFSLIVVSLSHLTTHFINEYFDFDTDALNVESSPWTGGSKVLPNMPEFKEISLICGISGDFIVFFLSVIYYNLFSISEDRGISSMIVWLIPIVNLIASFGYTAPPIQASRRMLSELWVCCVLNIWLPWMTYLVCRDASQLEYYHNESTVMLLPPKLMIDSRMRNALMVSCLVEWPRMSMMHVPDSNSDKLVGKHTIANTLGLTYVKCQWFISVSLFYLILLASLLPSHINDTFGSLYQMTSQSITVMFLMTMPLAMHVSGFILEKGVDAYELPLLASVFNGSVLVALNLALLYDAAPYFGADVQTILVLVSSVAIDASHLLVLPQFWSEVEKKRPKKSVMKGPVKYGHTMRV